MSRLENNNNVLITRHDHYGYLHCTSRSALCFTSPSLLLAEHQYFPESFFEAAKVRLFAVPTVIPSLIHVI